MRLRSAGETLRAHVPRRVPWEPWSVLVPLIVAQWLVVALVTLRRFSRSVGFAFPVFRLRSRSLPFPFSVARAPERTR